MKKILFSILFAASAFAANAQDVKAPYIAAPHIKTISCLANEITIKPDANVTFTATSDADWAKITQQNGKVQISVSQNYASSARTAVIKFQADNYDKCFSLLELTQSQNQTAAYMPGDIKISVASSQANTSQGGNEATKAFDGDLSTIWHSAWSPYFAISETTPATLTANFKNVDEIDYIVYNTRMEGGNNGNWGDVDVYAKYNNDATYRLVASKNFNYQGGIIKFTEPLLKPTSIQFRIKSGSSNNSGQPNFASAAEVEFYKVDNSNPLNTYFKDDLYTELADGITTAQIEREDNPFIKALASQIAAGNYSTQYRVNNYPCHLSTVRQSEIFGAPGKEYSKVSGITGINIKANTKQVVVVRDLDENLACKLRIVAWYVGKSGYDKDTGGPNTMDFVLQEGINIIDYKFAWDGLAYIIYEDGSELTYKSHKPLRVHFVNGEENGYVSLNDKNGNPRTNEELYETCKQAKNVCIDVFGDKVQLVWQANRCPARPDIKAGMTECCRAVDGSLGYRQYINAMNALVDWEHEALGFIKYNHLYDNRTMAYTNYSYYMFQGGFGVSFHYDQEKRVLDVNNLLNRDEDAIWGLSHEWGHQHQMTPYFSWSGLGEVSNNVCSYYNIMKYGYNDSRNAGGNPSNWTASRNNYINDALAKSGKIVSATRTNAYEHRDMVSYCQKMYDLCCANRVNDTYTYKAKDDNKNEITKSVSPVVYIPTVESEPTKGISIWDETGFEDHDPLEKLGVGQRLAPICFLMNYFLDKNPDFTKDWYEALRQVEFNTGSTCVPATANEKLTQYFKNKTARDKYELIACAQNGNKNNAYEELVTRFPESTWVKDGCIPATNANYRQNCKTSELNWIRQVSISSGYNLFPFFEQWGFLRVAAFWCGDYASGLNIFTQEMYDEFKADMQQMVTDGLLKECTPEMIGKTNQSISFYKDWIQPKPNFEN